MPNRISGAPDDRDNGLPDADLGETVYLVVYAECASVTDKIDKDGNEDVSRVFRPLAIETFDVVRGRDAIARGREFRTGEAPLPMDGAS